MDYEVLIIGAGMSGLAAGIRLAHFEKKVLIVEKHSAIGGLNSLYRLKGYAFDVGLHAMTNYVPKGSKGTPLMKLLKQLRIPYEDLDLCPQHLSEIAFPEKVLRFTNDFEFLRTEIAQNFPQQIDAFNRFVESLLAYDELSLTAPPQSALNVLNLAFSDPLLIEMLLLPLMYYGSAVEGDMEWGQFVIMFKSIFCEGFARPQTGVRHLLILLKNKFQKLGGELRLRCGVQALQAEKGEIVTVTLDTGESLRVEKILSSAGYFETLDLCSPPLPAPEKSLQGKMTFMESISVLNRPLCELGHTSTIVFFNDQEPFEYRVPQGLTDVHSGVICCPNHFELREPLAQELVRITNIAHPHRWDELSEEEYQTAKKQCFQDSWEVVKKFIPDCREFMEFTDIFTPKTIKKFTGHWNGAVYGCPEKQKEGRTPFKNLFICGTDQGFLGIVGALLSGISMANLHTLR
jgi:phytoene dehydrogenase-like protein